MFGGSTMTEVKINQPVNIVDSTMLIRFDASSALHYIDEEELELVPFEGVRIGKQKG